jgi:cobalt-zinc-cadmium efflux system outer membrane protein
MSFRCLLPVAGLLLLSGCLYHVRERSDEVVANLASRPFDLAPEHTAEPGRAGSTSEGPSVPEESSAAPVAGTDVQTAALMQAGRDGLGAEIKKYKLEIPKEVPGSEVPPIDISRKPGEPEAVYLQRKAAYFRKLYPPLPPLPPEPLPAPGPNGRPYTLADLQQLAAANSPTLRQAASDVEAARGNLIQAGAYPNPTLTYVANPNNNNSATGEPGFGVSQTIKTYGKVRLSVAAAQKALDNAELALRRARSDLSTQVRNAYFGLLVAKETMRVNGALARFTDEIYRLQVEMVPATLAAGYEPSALRSSTYTVRLAHKQAIQGYITAWQTLVAAIGLHQLPLTEVAGRIDTLIPYYDFDAVKLQVLRRHTDVLTALNGAEQARYNLKLAQITPYPDIGVSALWTKEMTVTPFGSAASVAVSVPIPLWDQNRGNIIAAEAALVRASEEPHRVELALTTSLATAYQGYKANLDALEYYRRFILPDQVRAYRGVFERRRIDPSTAFGDLVQAQQTLVTDVGTYLGILGSLWSSVVSVADLLQTDDLFQFAAPHALPELPALDHPLGWACPHGAVPVTPPPTASDCEKETR